MGTKLKMELGGSFETSVLFSTTTLCHISEARNLENLEICKQDVILNPASTSFCNVKELCLLAQSVFMSFV